MRKRSKIITIIMGEILLVAVIAITAVLMVSGSNSKSIKSTWN